jgi:uncharacterized membrane protein
MAALVTCQTAGAATPSFRGIGFLNMTGLSDPAYNNSAACGISADGSTVVGVSFSVRGGEAMTDMPFRWTAAGGMERLWPANHTNNNGNAVAASADGSFIAGSGNYAANYMQTFRWRNDTGAVFLGAVPPGVTSTEARAMSWDGSVIVGQGYGVYPQASVWVYGEGYRMLGFFGAPSGSSAADAVSGDGKVVVGVARVEQRNDAFVWTADSGMQLLAKGADARAVSYDGSIIAGEVGGNACRWLPDRSIQSLGTLATGNYSAGAAVSADGSVIVGASGSQAFIWDATNGMRSLQQVLADAGVNVSGWTLSTAMGISADGKTIVGYGTDPSGYTEGWVATIPEPACLSLLALGGLAVMRRKRK